MANKLQLALLQSFPNRDLLPFDVNDVAAVEAAVDARATGNRIFDLFWRELADADEDSIAELSRIIGEITGYAETTKTNMIDFIASGGFKRK